MEKEQHYKKNLTFFKEMAVEKHGYYDAHKELKHSRWQLMEREIFSEFVKKIVSSESVKKISDIGCGMGDYTYHLSKLYPDITFSGSDFSKEMIELANKKQKLPNNNFKVCDLRKLDFSDKEFDVTLCLNTLHHIHTDDLPKALSELARITKKHLVLEIKYKHSLYSYYKLWKYKQKNNPDYYFYMTSINLVKKVLKKEGFRLMKRRPIFKLKFLSPIVVLYFKRVSY
jgi:ubiquinone/menaquinone biosynthesis C-methylase UbiE